MTFDSEYFNLGYLDMLSYKETFVHKIDPRVKILVSFAFILFVVSMPKYELSALIPFFIYPVFLLTGGDVPLRAIAKKILFVSPFAIFIGAFNPLLDRSVLMTPFGVPVTGGWISFLSIIVKFVLTVSTALLLIAVTSFPGICEALARLKLPKIFVIQLLFLYRYLFVLLQESLRMIRAREARSFGTKGREIKTYIKFISVLLIRSIERAERIYQAMVSRGFRGEIRVLRKHSLKYYDILFAVAAISTFYLLKRHDIVGLIGSNLVLLFK